MVWTAGLDVDVGDPTKASDYDTLADNPEYLQTLADVEHDFNVSTGDGSHKDITFGADSTYSIGATASHALALYTDAAYVSATASGTYAASPGALNIGGGTSAESLTFHLNDTTSAQNQAIGNIDFWGNDAGAGDQIRAQITATYSGTGGSGEIGFLVWNGSALTEYMQIQDNGRVGIGNSIPDDVDGNLHVHDATAGAVTASANGNIAVFEDGASNGISILTPDANSGRVIFGSPSDNDNVTLLGWYNSGAQNFKINIATADIATFQSDGKVGIGTTSPDTRLTVDGGDMNVANGYGLIVGHTAGQTVGGNAAELQVLGTGGVDASLVIARYSADAGGPSIILGKSRGATIGSFAKLAANDSIGRIDFSASDDSDMNAISAQIEVQADATHGAINDAPGNMTLSTTKVSGNAPTAAMFIDSAQLVGISTVDPVARLEVEDGGTAKGIIFKVTQDDQNPYGLIVGNDYYSATDTNGFRVAQLDSGVAQFGNAGNNVMAFDTSGNVGIGTTSPGTTLEIKPSSGEGFAVRESDDGNNAFEVLGYATGAVLQLRQGGTGNFGVDSTASGFGFANLDGGFQFNGTAAPDTEVGIDGFLWIGGDDNSASPDRARDNAAPNGICINNDVTTSNIFFSVKDTGVTGQSTTDAADDDLVTWAKLNTTGGLQQRIASGDAADTITWATVCYGGTADITKTASAVGLIDFSVYESDGAGSTAEITANGNIFALRCDQQGGTFGAVFVVDEDGDVHYDGTTNATAWDFMEDGVTERDDIAMLSAFDRVRDPRGIIDNEFEDFYRYNEDDLVRAGILGDTLDNRGLVCLTRLTEFNTGGLRQLERKKADRVELAREVERRELLEATVAEQQELLLEAHEIIERLTNQLTEGAE